MPPEIDLHIRQGLFDAIIRVVDDRAGLIDTLVLDFAGTVFMDSQGVALVEEIDSCLRAAPDGPDLRLVVDDNGPDAVERVLSITRARRDIPVYDSLVEALAPTDPEL